MVENKLPFLEEKELSIESGEDFYAGWDVIEEDSNQNTILDILSNLRRALKLNESQWVDIYLHLITGRFLMQYRYLINVSYEKVKKGDKQSVTLAYEIGKLILDFVEKRKSDSSKPEFKGRSKSAINENKVIRLLTDLIYEVQTGEVLYKTTYLRNFATIVKRFKLEDVNPEIPLYIYKEVVERVPKEIFPDERKRRKFQNKVLKLREKMSFTDRHFRVAMRIIAENTEKRANYQFLEKTIPIIKTIPVGNIEDRVKEAKRILKDIIKKDQTIDSEFHDYSPEVVEPLKIDKNEIKKNSPLEKYKTERDFVFSEIKRIIDKYSERTSNEVKVHCNYILYDKTRQICFDLEKILKKRDRKKITIDMVEEFKKKDEEMKEIVLNIPKEELLFNYSRLWHILKDMLGDIWISEDSMNYLRSYLEKWLENRIIKAVEKMKEIDSWRKTLKVRDFKSKLYLK